MRVTVEARAGARAESIEEGEEGRLIVRVRAPAREGKANRAIQEALGRHFGVPKSAVTLVAGGRGRIKIFDIAR
jgi:uncharacterized protein (TIGR00251 family)